MALLTTGPLHTQAWYVKHNFFYLKVSHHLFSWLFLTHLSSSSIFSSEKHRLTSLLGHIPYHKQASAHVAFAPVAFNISV
jgi:hypothetical protein